MTSYATMTPYIPATDFSDDEAQQTGGRAPIDTSGLDAELAALVGLTDAVRHNIDLIVRTDGRIQDKFVELHGLHPDIISQISANLITAGSSGETVHYFTDTGSADAIVGNITPAPASYFSGLAVWCLMNASVTGGPVTINLNGLGTISVKQGDGTTDPFIGEPSSGGIAYLVYDGTVFQHINKASSAASLSAHLADVANPHAVTAAQVGALAGDPTDTNTDRDKLFSNNDMKLVNDYRLVTHLPLGGGTVTGAVNLSGANTFSGLNSFTNTTSMTAQQFRGAHVAAVASASTVDLGALLGNSCIITGTTGINNFGTVQAGVTVFVEFAAALTLNHSATIILPGGGNIITVAGDTLIAVSLGSGDWKIHYQRGDGSALTAPTGTVPTGAVIPYIGITAPSTWVMANGDTIGNAASGADRANADTNALFNLLWDSMADAQAAVSSGRGASAQADFDADKTIVVSDAVGKGVFGTGGTKMATHGDNGGLEGVTLITSEMPSHVHTTRRFSGNAAASNNVGTDSFNSTPVNTAIDTASTGGDGEHENMPPWLALSWIIKL